MSIVDEILVAGVAVAIIITLAAYFLAGIPPMELWQAIGV